MSKRIYAMRANRRQLCLIAGPVSAKDLKTRQIFRQILQETLETARR